MLRSRSPWFDAALRSQWVESETNVIKFDPNIVSPRALLTILDYIYRKPEPREYAVFGNTWREPAKACKDIIEFIRAAEHLLLRNAVEVGLKCLENHLVELADKVKIWAEDRLYDMWSKIGRDPVVFDAQGKPSKLRWGASTSCLGNAHLGFWQGLDIILDVEFSVKRKIEELYRQFLEKTTLIPLTDYRFMSQLCKRKHFVDYLLKNR